MSVEIENLTKRFGLVPVVDRLNVHMRSNAISVLLGPSGCGKTTTLRCIAGLEEPTSGSINIHGTIVFSDQKRINLPPEKRDLGMVFQSYAIWPHMTVYENIALPIRAHGGSAKVVRQRVDEVLSLVGLTEARDRSATQLSGGQQQRVAIARCLVTRPQLMLLDEPLSNLDAKLRVEMRKELKDLQRRTESTMIFVTHDQEEAMSLADEIFLFRSGQIVQHGPPQEVYRKPNNRYVAEFLGKANLIPVRTRKSADGLELTTTDGQHRLGAGDEREGDWIGMIRPEAWLVGGSDGPGLRGRVTSLMFLGDRAELTVATPVGEQLVLLTGYNPVAVGDVVSLAVDRERMHLLPAES
jgi:iron(III) transport system ATP-binding protein